MQFISVLNIGLIFPFLILSQDGELMPVVQVALRMNYYYCLCFIDFNYSRLQDGLNLEVYFVILIRIASGNQQLLEYE